MATEMERRHPTEVRPKTGGGFFQRLFGEGGVFKSSGPALDVIDRANELLVRADLPGLDQNDVSVEVDGRNLTIWGERHEEREERDESYYYSERWEGSFKRTIELPEGVDPTRACASFDQGVLEVCFPKTAPKSTGRRIEVTGPSAGQGVQPQGVTQAQTPISEQQAVGTPTYGAGATTPGGVEKQPSQPSARRIEVTGPPSGEESKIVSPTHSPAEDLGRH